MSKLHYRFAAPLLLVVLLSLLVISWRAAEIAERVLLPEIAAKAAGIGRSVDVLVDRGLAAGIPLDRLAGVDSYFRRLLAENGELAYLALYPPGDGPPLFAAGPAPARGPAAAALPSGQGGPPTEAAIPIAGPGGRAAGTLVVGIDPAFTRATVGKLWIDLGIVLVVTALVALELVSICFGTGAYGALEGLEQRLHCLGRGDLRRHPPVGDRSEFGRLATVIDARLQSIHEQWARLRRRLRAPAGTSAARPLGLDLAEPPPPTSAQAVRALVFLFMVADELNRPFLPVFVRQLTEPVPGFSLEFLISLPLVLFMAIVALAQPVLGEFTRRYGRGRSLITGAGFGVAGHLLAAVVDDLSGLLIARGITAAGFALVFVAGQGFVIDTTTTETRSRGLAVFIGAILVAALCGPPIGGIIADRLGFRTVFLVGAAVNLLGLVLAASILPRTPGAARDGPGEGLTWGVLRLVLGSPRLLALLIGCALPAKLILSATSFFLVPLYLESLGYDQSAVGRTLMLYALAMVLLVPVFAAGADRLLHRRAEFVVVGGVLAGAASVYWLGAPGIWGPALMLLQLGVAQALSIGAQSALVGTLGAQLPRPIDESTLYGVFRLIERSGNALGPAVAGALVGAYGFGATVTAIGAAVAFGAGVFYLVFHVGGGGPSRGSRPSKGSLVPS